jgi:hypothetical protein
MVAQGLSIFNKLTSKDIKTSAKPKSEKTEPRTLDEIL